MALTKKDQEILAEIVINAIANRSGTISNETMSSQIAAIVEQVKINEGIFNEIKKVGVSIEAQAKSTQKLLDTLTNGMSTKIDAVHKDVSTKEGYLAKLSNKVDYLWVPLVLGLVALIAGIFV